MQDGLNAAQNTGDSRIGCQAGNEKSAEILYSSISEGVLAVCGLSGKSGAENRDHGIACFGDMTQAVEDHGNRSGKDTLKCLEQCQDDTDKDGCASDADDFPGSCVLMGHI